MHTALPRLWLPADECAASAWTAPPPALSLLCCGIEESAPERALSPSMRTWRAHRGTGPPDDDGVCVCVFVGATNGRA